VNRRGVDRRKANERWKTVGVGVMGGERIVWGAGAEVGAADRATV
jgi:hypothetical protein